MKSTKQSIIESQERQIKALKEEVSDYRERHDCLVKIISELAMGRGVKPDYYQEGIHDWNVAMQNLATLAVEKVMKMRLKKSGLI